MRYVRKRLDVDWSDLASGLASCLRPPNRRAVLRRLAACWPEPDMVVPCLSVRSGFDLLLSSVDWPPGSEVLMSAITIPHMATLVRLHGFTPIPIDVDLDTLLVASATVRDAVTPRTRAVVFSHLFGARADLTDLARLSREMGLLFIEDRAQSFAGAPDRLGDADVALYSFGSIKTATCLGGAVLLIRDAELRNVLIERQATHPYQSTSAYAGKLLKGGLMLGLGTPTLFSIFTRVAHLTGSDPEAILRHLSRSFSDAHLPSQIRRQPSTALLAVLQRRLAGYDKHRVEARRQAGERFAAQLSPIVTRLGGRADRHTHWLFPVICTDPEAIVAAGRAVGFDLTRGSSALVALGPASTNADMAMQNVVYLPLCPRMPESATGRLATAISTATGDQGKQADRVASQK